MTINLVNRRVIFTPALATGVSYTGPGDLVAGWSAWWGLRAFSAATIGTNCIKLRRDSDQAVLDFVTLANGSLDVASIATWKGAANLFVDTLYDQSGNGRNVGNTTAGDQPSFTLSGLGSRPIMTDVSTDALIQTAGPTVTQAQPFSVSAVANFDGVAGRSAYFGTDDNATPVYVGSRGGASEMNSGGDGDTTVANGWHRVQSTFNTPSFEQYIDGTPNSVSSVGSNVMSGELLRIFADSSGTFWHKSLVEVGMYPGAFTTPNKSALDANQQTYWGI